MRFSDLQDLMADVFEVDAASIHPNSTPDDISAWDSLRVLELLLAIEKQHGVSVSPEKLPDLMSVGAILAAVNGAKAAA